VGKRRFKFSRWHLNIPAAAAAEADAARQMTKTRACTRIKDQMMPIDFFAPFSPH
jgi:hypothetical protein